MQVHACIRRTRGGYMLENCKCGENKIATDTDGRFAYQYCIVCNDVVGVLYLGVKENIDNIDEGFLGI
jgi:hypothetical protein